MKRRFTLFFLLSIFCLNSAKAENYQGHQDFEKYSVHYNVFNSTFIPAHVAANYGLKRSKYESLLNVSVAPIGEYGAIPANISGTVTNLMQQQKTLKFVEISKKTATYYLAPIRISGEENVRIELQVTPRGESETLHLKFNKKVFSDP